MHELSDTIVLYTVSAFISWWLSGMPNMVTEARICGSHMHRTLSKKVTLYSGHHKVIYLNKK